MGTDEIMPTFHNWYIRYATPSIHGQLPEQDQREGSWAWWEPPDTSPRQAEARWWHKEPYSDVPQPSWSDDTN